MEIMRQCKKGRVATREFSELLGFHDLRLIDDVDTMLDEVNVDLNEYSIALKFTARVKEEVHEIHHAVFLAIVAWFLVGCFIMAMIVLYSKVIIIRKRNCAPNTENENPQRHSAIPQRNEDLIQHNYELLNVT